METDTISMYFYWVDMFEFSASAVVENRQSMVARLGCAPQCEATFRVSSSPYVTIQTLPAEDTVSSQLPCMGE